MKFAYKCALLFKNVYFTAGLSGTVYISQQGLVVPYIFHSRA